MPMRITEVNNLNDFASLKDTLNDLLQRSNQYRVFNMGVAFYMVETLWKQQAPHNTVRRRG
jgi:phosphoribosylaminoimidazole (AIR) synthetase